MFSLFLQNSKRLFLIKLLFSIRALGFNAGHSSSEGVEKEHSCTLKNNLNEYEHKIS
jgi:hypothetical protein